MKIPLNKKIFLPLVSIALLFSGTIFFISGTKKKDTRQTVYLAVAGPLGGTVSSKGGPLSGMRNANGRDMLKGIELGLEAMQQQGKMKNFKIELIHYDEKNNKDALKNASEIVDENKVLAVLGHYTNSGAVAAGAIYRNNGIPALTASAADERITKDNEWYFKIPDRRNTRVVLALTVKNLLEEDVVSIIYDKSSYGSTMVEDFKRQAEKTDLRVKPDSWLLDSNIDNHEDFEHQIKGIVGKLRAVQDPGTIFCALYPDVADDIFTALRYPGTDFKILGPNSFSTPSFIAQFNEYPHEKTSPGYYTDGIYAVSPFIAYLADSDSAWDFRRKNTDRYGIEPSWVTANYYDAALLLVNAMERAEIKGKGIRADRQRLKKALKSFNEPDNSVQGVTGKLYFDQERTVPRPALQLGVWRRHQFLPAYFQYREAATESKSGLMADKKNSVPTDQTNAEKKQAINGQQLKRYRVVYAGIDINHISNIDTKQGQFTADFYIWFRYAGLFDDNNIIFPDAVTPVMLGTPSIKKAPDGANIHVYKVQADFLADFNVYSYPLDRHKLRIRFRHQQETRDDLIYVPDIEGLPFLTQKNDQGQSMIRTIPDWDVKDISYTQQIVAGPPLADHKTVYSAFDTHVEIQRHKHTILLIKIFSPLLFIIISWYFIFFRPGSTNAFQLSALLLATLFTLWFRLLYSSSLPGQGLITDISFLLYLAIGAGALTSTTLFLLRFYRKTGNQRERYLLCAGQALYLTLSAGGTVFVIYTSWNLLHS